MTTNWDQLADFYRTTSLSNRIELAQHGLSMFELVQKLSNRPEHKHINAIIEKLDLVLWSGDMGDGRVYVSSTNSGYKFSLNDFYDSETLGEDRIVQALLGTLFPTYNKSNDC